MYILNRLYGWYGKRVVLSVLSAIVVLVIAGIVLTMLQNGDISPEEAPRASVQLSRVEDLSNRSEFSAIGTVEAVSEAQLQTEASGRVTGVYVEIGDTVRAGTVLASIENSREAAAVLQAEGAYEASLANAEQSEVSVGSTKDAIRSADTTGWNTYRSAFIDTDDVMRNTLDSLFNDANRQRLLLDEFMTERRTLRYALEAWGEDTLVAPLDEDDPSKNVLPALDKARSETERLALFVDTLYEHLARIERTTDDATTDALVATYKTELSAARATLNSTKGEISSARAGILDSRARYEQAVLAATGGVTSLADAQVKQTLGVLRAAQANYEKTLVRAPIVGTVNALYLKEGTYVSMSTPAAIVANNNALEIRTGIAQEDSAFVSVGDAVMVDNRAMGTVTAVAPAVDPQTGKVAVKIAVEDTLDIENGSVVNVTFTSVNEDVPDDTQIVIPISALKMTPDGPVVFTVNDTMALTPIAVTLGAIRGDTVEIESGITMETEIVADARGLKEGEIVDVIGR